MHKDHDAALTALEIVVKETNVLAGQVLLVAKMNSSFAAGYAVTMRDSIAAIATQLGVLNEAMQANLKTGLLTPTQKQAVMTAAAYLENEGAPDTASLLRDAFPLQEDFVNDVLVGMRSRLGGL